MKKALLSFLLFLTACSSSVDWYQNNQHFSMNDVADQYKEWLMNPEQLITDFSPILVEMPEYRINFDGDTVFFQLSQVEKDRNRQASEMLEFNQKLWKSLTPANIADVIERNIIIIRNDPEEFYFSFLDLNENLLYTAMITAPFFALPGAGQTKMAREMQSFSKLAIFATKDAIKVFKFKGMNIVLREGSKKFGKTHYLRNHTPKSFITRGLDPKKLKKTLFLTSDEKYIQKLLSDFTKSKQVYLVESQSIHKYLVYEGKIMSDCGIVRKYKLIINKENQSIVSFYPTNNVPLEYIYNQKYDNYIQLTYKKTLWPQN